MGQITEEQFLEGRNAICNLIHRKYLPFCQQQELIHKFVKLGSKN